MKIKNRFWKEFRPKIFKFFEKYFFLFFLKKENVSKFIDKYIFYQLQFNKDNKFHFIFSCFFLKKCFSPMFRTYKPVITSKRYTNALLDLRNWCRIRETMWYRTLISTIKFVFWCTVYCLHFSYLGRDLFTKKCHLASFEF